MKPNITSVLKYLPQNIKFNKSDLSECSFILRNKMDIKRKLDREQDSELIADTFLNLLKQRKSKIKEDEIIYKKVSALYHICVPFKVDCYNASCRFMEYKFCEFIECPDRIPSNPKYKEEEGYYWNKIMKKTGYFKDSCGSITEKMNINNHEKYIVENLLEEFKQFVKTHHRVLKKYQKRKYIDYSHLAYNGATNDF